MKWFRWTSLLAILVSAPVFAEEVTIQGTEEADRKKLSDGIVRFEQGSSNLTEASLQTLDRIEGYIKKNSAGGILIVGHTDRHGSARLNRTLSKKRADVVKRALIKRGISSSRLSVIGLGYQEPLSTEKSEKADELNRRVELWVGTREAIAYVSWVRKQVEAKKPAAAGWDPAQIKMSLRKLFRVRTVGQRSAGEITFKVGNRLYLGPESLMVLYGLEKKSKRRKRKVSEITLEEGSLFAQLAERERKPMEVATKAARFRIFSRKTRLDYKEKGARSTVSVYDGKADVSAQGSSVQVKKGFGTRVKVGQAPEEPRRLLPPPAWGGGPFKGPAGALEVRWQPGEGAAQTIIEVFSPDDQKMERPLRTFHFEGQSGKLDLEPGNYRLRATSVDDREVVGLPSAPVDASVVPALVGADGQPLVSEGGVIKLPKPGVFKLPKLQGIKLSWTHNGDPITSDSVVLGPGRHRLSWHMANGQGASEVLQVEVASLQMKLESVSEPVYKDGLWRRRAVVKVFDGKGKGVPGLGLVIRKGASADMILGVSEPTSPDGPMADCRCIPSAFLPKAEDLGDGQYAFEDAQATTMFSVSQVSVIDAESRTARTIQLPAALVVDPASTAGPPPESGADFRSTWHIGGMVGAQLAAEPSIAPAFALQGGLTLLGKHDYVRLNLGLEVGLITGSMESGGVTGRLLIVPILARLDVGFQLSILRPYIGGEGGLSVLTFSADEGSPNINPNTVQPAYNGLLGLGFSILAGEVFVEGRIGLLGIQGTALDAQLGGPTVMLGYRWSPPVD